MSAGDESPNPQAADAGGCELPDFIRLARARIRLIALCAIGFAVVAVVVTTLRGPRYESSAFLEIEHLDEVPTIEEKLRFPSLYRAVSEDDAAAARSLRQRTRIKAARGSRLVAITVSHPDPEAAALEANALAEAFLQPEPAGEPASGISLDALPDPEAADSPESLASAWKTQSAEFEKLSARYENDAEHPAVKGAAERLAKLGDRIESQVAEWHRRTGLAPAESDADTGAQLDHLLGRIAEARNPAAAPPQTSEEAPKGIRLAESAAPALGPVGPSLLLLGIGALALGAFTGFLAALGGCCHRSKS